MAPSKIEVHEHGDKRCVHVIYPDGTQAIRFGSAGDGTFNTDERAIGEFAAAQGR